MPTGYEVEFYHDIKLIAHELRKINEVLGQIALILEDKK